jgi:hypothetical protein
MYKYIIPIMILALSSCSLMSSRSNTAVTPTNTGATTEKPAMPEMKNPTVSLNYTLRE